MTTMASGAQYVKADKLRAPSAPIEELPEKTPMTLYPTLFGQDSSDEESDIASNSEELSRSPIILDLRDVVSNPLSTLPSMLEVLLPRIKPRPEIKQVSMEDQQSFVSIITGELANQFPVLHKEIDDPFLSEEDNFELHKQMSISVCRNLEQLYGAYIYKAASKGSVALIQYRGGMLNTTFSIAIMDSPGGEFNSYKRLQEGILSIEASMSQLRAALAVDANKRLNIPRMRAEILENIRGPIVDGPVVDRYCGTDRRPPIPKQQAARQRRGPKKDMGDAQEMKSALAQLDSKHTNIIDSTLNTLNTLYKSRGMAEKSVDKSVVGEVGNEEEQRGKEEEKKSGGAQKRTIHYFTQLRRVSSLPNLWGDFLLCDMKITTRDKRPADVQVKEDLMDLHRPPSIQDMTMKDWNPVKAEIPLGDYTQNDFCDDLDHLVRRSTEAKSEPIGQDELHPLLQARVYGISKARRLKLQTHNASLRKQQEDGSGVESKTTAATSIDVIESIPSVPTMEQLPYMDIEHVSGTMLSNLSLHVKSGLPKADVQESFISTGAPPSPSQLDTSIRRSRSARLSNSRDSVRSHSRFDVSEREGRSEPGSSFGQTSVASREGFSSSSSPQTPRTTSTYKSPGDTISRTTSVGGMTRPSQQDDEEEEDGIKLNLDYPSMATMGAYSSPLPSFPVSGQRSSSDVLTRETGDHQEPGPATAALQDETLDPQPQPDVVSAEVPGKGLVRTAHVRVSNRVPLVELKLKPYGPIYNELDHDWDSAMTEDLDSTLYEGKEVTAVYNEIMKILPNEHMFLESEPTLEPSLTRPVNLSKIFASTTLHHRRSRRVVNKDLHRSIPCPWADTLSKKEWEGVAERKFDENKPVAVTSKKIINTQDYLKFVSRGETDYLRLVYHLYDSQGSDSEDEEEARKKREKIANLHAKLRAREKRKAQRYKDKSYFCKGQWNVNTVMMGGLGGDISPESSDKEDEDSLRKLNEKAGTMEIVQSNLKVIWTRLYLPELQQIDMAIKYSTNISATELNKVLNLWEQACNYIEEREEALLKLETFEKTASDPSRLFARGVKGSASIRLEEARERDKLHSTLNQLDLKTSQIIKKLYKQYGDIVTYKGRLYSEKMRLDRTEMLYHLQQIRRQELLKPALLTRSVPTTKTNTPSEVIPVNH